MFAAYVYHINGQLRIKATPEVNQFNYHSHALLATARNEIDFGVHLYNQMTLNSEWAEGELTYSLTQTCLMVPWLHEGYVNQVMKYSWQSILLLLLTLLIFCSICWQLCWHNGWKGFYIALAATFNQSLEDKVFRKFKEAYKFVHLGVILGSFTMWNIRNASLSSITSTNQHGQQIDTVQDFLRTPLRIMLTDTEVDMYFTTSLLPEELKERIVVVNSSTRNQHIQELNTSYAYCIPTPQWDIYQVQQHAMTEPIFRRAFPKLCTPQYVKKFPVQRNSPFRSHFQIFYTSVSSFGFNRKWEDDSIVLARRIGLIKMNVKYRTTCYPFTLYDLRRLFYVYLVGNAIAIFCLLCEILCKEWSGREFFLKILKQYFAFPRR